jgi:cytochrome c heme-lyase
LRSAIPKGGTEGTWTYPSPQMFWNALVRKQKVDGASEEDMETVVAIHNNMNENTWKQVGSIIQASFIYMHEYV